MKKLLSVILACAVIAASGCSDNGEAVATTSATEATTTAVTTTTEAVTTTTTAATTTEATTTAPETEIVTDPETGKITGTGLIKNAKTGDGFISFDKTAIIEDFAASGFSEKLLTVEAVMADHERLGNNSENLYFFAINSEKGVMEVPSHDNSVFMTQFILNNELYSISFGTSDKLTMDEVLPYCAPEKYIEYWAFASVSDSGNIILLPFIAGTEQNGYYLVQPVLKMLDSDVSEMTIPEPVGNDSSETDSSYELEITELTDGSAVLDITGVENFGDFVSASIAIENKYNVPLIFTSSNIVVNGTDLGSFTAFLEVPAGETVNDYLWVDDCELKAGDELEITFTLQNAETFEYYGPITFKMTLENIAVTA